ncbi:MAG: hypothetical protein KUG77_14015 [Nannocystaceae bacterium]|nr:hypothetical protein [Nannocystaceae bacterium]
MLDVQDHVSASLLSDYLRGELAAAAEGGVEDHIGTCLVCARRLREEAQLEMLLHDACDVHGVSDGFESPAASAQQRRALWQRVAATVANTAAAAAALLLVINPSQPLGSQSTTHAASHDGTSVSASAFINDALCFPSADTSASVTDAHCEEPLMVSMASMVAMVTDPDDYLSPFDASWLGRGSAINACQVEDLACEPS